MSNLEFIESAIEQLLGVLARRDDNALEALTSDIADLAREKRRALGVGQLAPSLNSGLNAPSNPPPLLAANYELGAVEVLEALAVKASARAPLNARFEVVRRRHALELLQALALAPKQTSTPTQLAAVLDEHRSNISRLIDAMLRVGVVKASRSAGSFAGAADGRSSPLQITSVGIEMLDGLRPDWRSGRPAAKKPFKGYAMIDLSRADVSGRIVEGFIATDSDRLGRPSKFRIIKIGVADRAAMAVPVVTINAANPFVKPENKASIATNTIRSLRPGTSAFVATKSEP